MKTLTTKLPKIWQFLCEVPKIAFLNVRALALKAEGKIVSLVEITTTNEFFYLRPVLERLHNDGNLVIIMTAHPRVYHPLRELVRKHFRSPVPVLVNSMWYNSFIHLDFYINATLSYDIKVPPRARHKINFPHTITSKGKDDVFSGAIEKITDVFVTGPAMQNDLEIFYKDRLISKTPTHHPVGCPKADGLLQTKIEREKLLVEIGLDPTRPTIMYAPTWNPEASIFSWLPSVLGIPQKYNANLIIKVHPGAYIDPTNKKSSGGIDWESFLTKESVRRQRIFNAFEVDSPDYINASDITITDISTIWIEFYLLNKPIIFIDIPEFFKLHGMNSLGDFRNDYGFLVENEAKFETIINGLINKSLPPRQAPPLTNRLLYNQGKATEVAVEEIKKLYKQTK